MNRSSASRAVVYFFILVGVLFSTNNLYAIENTFKISASVVGVDYSAPSVPVGLAATSVSSSQINLVWNPSADNVAVVGYRIYRQGVFIATSSSPSYSDIGLFSSTLYSYQVDAFDAQFNFSSLSATSSATTSSTSVPHNTSSGSRSSRNVDGAVSLESQVQVIVEKTAASLVWNTKDFARANIYWGQTNDFELGTISGAVFQKDHVANIENLIPDTRYVYRIELESSGGEVALYEGSFFTDKDMSSKTLLSPIITAKAQDRSIVLSWRDVVGDAQEVRIVRSDTFFPIDPYDGKTMYQNMHGTQFVDTNVEEGRIYYYALFMIGTNNTYSAPSIVKASIGKDQELAFSDTVYSESYETMLKDITVTDFDFIQKGLKLSFSAGGLALLAQTATEIYIDEKKIPLGIKTIGVTFTPVRARSEAITFLLAYSKERDSYVGLIPPLESDQEYNIDITIFNTLNERVKTIQIVARVEVDLQKNNNPGIIIQTLNVARDNKVFSIIVLLLGFVVGFVLRRL